MPIDLVTDNDTDGDLTRGFALYATSPTYDNRDAIVGSRTTLTAIFINQWIAEEYAHKIEESEQGEVRTQVKPCQFYLSLLEGASDEPRITRFDRADTRAHL